VFRNRFVAVAALAAALAVPAAAFAQAPPPAGAPATAPHGHHNPMRAALGQLNLSPAQKSQLDGVFAQAKQMRQANQTADPATRKANRDAFIGKIDAILTPDQRTQFHASLAQMRAQHKQHA
jgi:Spy/CpxP family protein refolding chaperone